MPRLKGSADLLEDRRRRALALLDSGYSLNEVGRASHRALATERLAADKKNAARLYGYLVFADESGFLLIPHVAKTWSPQGCTPVHYHRQGRRDKVSVISGISVSPQRQRLGL